MAEVKKYPRLGSRHGQALLMFLGLMSAYSLRVNLSVGVVAMTDITVNPNFPVVNWTTAQKGTILGSFFWGYLFTQVPAGVLASKFGPSFLLGGAMVFCGLATMTIPVAAIQGNWIIVCAMRVLQGLGQGVVYPCVNTHMSKWAVPEERSRLYALVFGGTQVGTIVMLVTGGLLAGGQGGWPSIYYVSGALAIIWGVVCLFYGADSPSKHKTISKTEKDYIEKAMAHTSSNSHKLSIPWSSFLCSLPLWALLIVHSAQNWGFWTLLTLMPTYINGVLDFDIKQNGFLSSLPYLAMWIVSFLFAYTSDYMIKKKILSVTVSRKLWNSVAHYGGAAALVALAYLAKSPEVAVTLLTVSVALNAGTYMGYLANHLDLSPNFGGVLMGITNGISNLTSILGPLAAGLIVTNEKDPYQWKIVFLVSAAIFVVGNTIFNFFGSASVQPWNEGKKKDISSTTSE